MLTKQNVSPELTEINSRIAMFHEDMDNCLHHAKYLMNGAAHLLVTEELDEELVCSINAMLTLSIHFVDKAIILDLQTGKKR